MVDRFGGEAQRFRDGGELVFDLLARIIDFIVVQRIERAPAFRDADGERPFELIGMELPLERPFRRVWNAGFSFAQAGFGGRPSELRISSSL